MFQFPTLWKIFITLIFVFISKESLNLVPKPENYKSAKYYSLYTHSKVVCMQCYMVVLVIIALECGVAFS